MKKKIKRWWCLQLPGWSTSQVLCRVRTKIFPRKNLTKSFNFFIRSLIFHIVVFFNLTLINYDQKCVNKYFTPISICEVIRGSFSTSSPCLCKQPNLSDCVTWLVYHACAIKSTIFSTMYYIINWDFIKRSFPLEKVCKNVVFK